MTFFASFIVISMQLIGNILHTNPNPNVLLSIAALMMDYKVQESNILAPIHVGA